MGSGAQFLIDLQARFASLTPAQSALASLEKQIVKEKAALDGLEKKLLASTPKQAGALLKQVDAQRASLAGLNKAVPAWQAFAKQSTQSAGKLEDLVSAAKEAGGPVGDLASKAEGLSSVLGKGGIAGAALIAVAAVFAVAAAVVYATGVFLKFALLSADAARSVHLLDVAAAGGAIQGAELNAVVSQLARRVPLAREKIAEMARGLIDAKLAGVDMQNALIGIATVASARGEQAAGAIEAIAKQSAGLRRFVIGARDMRGEFVSLAGTGIKAADVYEAVAKTLGISVAAAQAKVLSGTIGLKQGMEILAAVTKAKFGGTIAGQMLALENQVAKARENFGLLFGSVNIDKFLVGLDKVGSMLSQDSFIGSTLKRIFGDVLTKFFDRASEGFPYVRAALLGAVVGVLNLYLAFLLLDKKLGPTLEKIHLFGDTEGIDKIEWAFNAGVIAVNALGFALEYALKPLSDLSTQIDVIDKLLNGNLNIDLTKPGSSMIESLIAGILSQKSALGVAVAAVAAVIPSTVAMVLQQHSPSRIGVAQGAMYGHSMAIGQKASQDEVEHAAAGLGGAAVRGGGSGAMSSPGAGDRKWIAKELHFHLRDDESLKAEVTTIVFDLFEREGARE